MVDDADDYRRNPAFAQREADHAKNERDKAAWLRVGRGLAKPLKYRRRPTYEAFTVHDISKSLH